MSAPKRLLEDPDTLESLRTDLQAAAQHQVAYDVSAGLARFEASLANLGPDLGPGLDTNGASLGVSKAALVKLGVVGAVGTALVGVALYSMQQPTVEDRPSPTVSTASQSVARPDPRPEADAEPSVAPLPVAPTESASEAEPVSPPKRIKPAPIQKQAAPADRGDLLAEEVKQLRKIREALNQNPAQALAWANEGHARFRRGHLYQEREALALRALNALGRRSELEQRGERYLRAFPEGSFSNQVRQMLGR